MKIIIWVVVVLILISGGVYYFSLTDTVAPESDWQTYKSSTYDYEIKYPPEYNLLWNNIFAPNDVPGVDTARYVDENYDFQLQIFARDGFVLDSCLKDLSGKDITKTITANGNNLYVYNDHEKGLGGRMALIEGAIKSEYRAIHDDHCYILIYTIAPTDSSSLSPNQLSEKVDILDRIISTFKFTK